MTHCSFKQRKYSQPIARMATPKWFSERWRDRRPFVAKCCSMLCYVHIGLIAFDNTSLQVLVSGVNAPLAGNPGSVAFSADIILSRAQGKTL